MIDYRILSHSEKHFVDATPTPEALIRVAVWDLKKTLKDDRYTFNIDTWHDSRAGICHFCVAGSVIVQHLHADPKVTKNAINFPKAVKQRLFSLDSFARGDIFQGLLKLLISPATFPYVSHRQSMPKDGNKLASALLEVADEVEGFRLWIPEL